MAISVLRDWTAFVMYASTSFTLTAGPDPWITFVWNRFKGTCSTYSLGTNAVAARICTCSTAMSEPGAMAPPFTRLNWNGVCMTEPPRNSSRDPETRILRCQAVSTKKQSYSTSSRRSASVVAEIISNVGSAISLSCQLTKSLIRCSLTAFNEFLCSAADSRVGVLVLACGPGLARLAVVGLAADEGGVRGRSRAGHRVAVLGRELGTLGVGTLLAELQFIGLALLCLVGVAGLADAELFLPVLVEGLIGGDGFQANLPRIERTLGEEAGMLSGRVDDRGESVACGFEVWFNRVEGQVVRRVGGRLRGLVELQVQVLRHVDESLFLRGEECSACACGFGTR